MGVDQGRVLERVHLVLDEGSVCYRGPTWRRLGERGAIWAPFRTELTVKIAKWGTGVPVDRTDQPLAI